MRTPRFLRFAIPVVAALLVAGGAIAVTASATGLKLGSLVAATSTPSPKASAGTAAGTSKLAATCQSYMSHLASQLGVSQAKLDAANAAALKATVQDQVTSGKLTQPQADKIEAKLPRSISCVEAIRGLGRTNGSVAKGSYITAAAAVLGITEAELKQDFKNGQDLSQVAAAKNVTEADFKAKVVASIKAKLDAAVSAKTITQSQEDAQLARLQAAAHLPYWTSVHK